MPAMAMSLPNIRVKVARPDTDLVCWHGIDVRKCVSIADVIRELRDAFTIEVESIYLDGCLLPCM
jgi:hypothetical protein